MENSKLPIDVCELIIDCMAVDWNPYSDPPCFLLACALTCKAWTPRSLYTLYSVVYLDARSATMFIDCLVRFPARAAWVRELYLNDDLYIPMGLLLSQQLLVNCETLGFDNSQYPAFYMDRVVKPLLSLHSGIMCLYLQWNAKHSSLSSLCNLLCALPRLQILSLCTYANSSMNAWEVAKWSKLIQKGICCKHLQKLTL